MATFSLSGSGVQALSSGVGALHVSVTTMPASAGSGKANPPDRWGVGYIRFGDGVGFWQPYIIVDGPQWIPCPNGSTSFGYAVLETGVVQVVEVFGSSPLAYPLASLPDVSLSAPAAGQVLTYSGAHWANATPAAGGGGGRTLIYSQTLATATSFALATGWAAPTDGQRIDVEVYGAIATVSGWIMLTLQIGDATSLKTVGYSYATVAPGNAGVTTQGFNQSRAFLTAFINSNNGSGSVISPGMSFMALSFHDAGGTTPQRVWTAQGLADYGTSSAIVAVGQATGWCTCGPITRIAIGQSAGSAFSVGSRIRVYLLN